VNEPSVPVENALKTCIYADKISHDLCKYVPIHVTSTRNVFRMVGLVGVGPVRYVNGGFLKKL
jgi:hypothetical protein